MSNEVSKDVSTMLPESARNDGFCKNALVVSANVNRLTGTKSFMTTRENARADYCVITIERIIKQLCRRYELREWEWGGAKRPCSRIALPSIVAYGANADVAIEPVRLKHHLVPTIPTMCMRTLVRLSFSHE